MSIKQELKELKQSFYQALINSLNSELKGQRELLSNNYFESMMLEEEISRVLADKQEIFEAEFNSQLSNQYPECVDMVKIHEQGINKIIECLEAFQTVSVQVTDIMYPDTDVMYNSEL